MPKARKAHQSNGHDVFGIEWVRLAERPPSVNGKSASLSIVDLFCGCGGLTLGIWEAARRHHRKLDIRLAIDLSQKAIAVYSDNFDSESGQIRCDDVGRLFPGGKGHAATSVERYWCGLAKNVDLIVAGPPCQGHSDLNNSTRRADPRNGLYLRVIRAAELMKPKALIVENVPAVVHDTSAVVPNAVAWLQGMGYRVADGVVSFSRFGIPQLRKRHVLVACRSVDFDFDKLIESDKSAPSAGDFLSGLEDEPELRDGTFYKPSSMTDTNKKRVEYLFANKLYDLPNHMRPSCHKDKVHAYVSMYGRMHWNKPSQTLTSGFGSMGQGRYVHPKRKRLLTPHEAARLQGFPDFFSFAAAQTVTSLREMIANAVPPQFTAVLVSRLISLGIL